MTDLQQQIVDMLNGFKSGVNPYGVFNDWVALATYAFSNQVLYSQKLEDRYFAILNKYNKVDQERFPHMLGLLASDLEDEMKDSLGAIYMAMDAGNSRTGQFFTPYHLSKMMAAVADKQTEIVTINEPSCGGGANIIAYLQTQQEKGLDYQSRVKIYAQDIDFRCVCMCYTQLSLLGADAVVVLGDTLKEEVTMKFYTPGYLINGCRKR